MRDSMVAEGAWGVRVLPHDDRREMIGHWCAAVVESTRDWDLGTMSASSATRPFGLTASGLMSRSSMRSSRSPARVESPIAAVAVAMSIGTSARVRCLSTSINNPQWSSQMQMHASSAAFSAGIALATMSLEDS